MGLSHKKMLQFLSALIATGWLSTGPGNRIIALAANTHSSPAGAQRSTGGWPKSRFYGAINLRFKGDDVYIHVYDIKRADASPNRSRYGAHDYAPNERAFKAGLLSDTDPYYRVQRCYMDLLARQKGGSFRLINSIKFDYIRFVDIRGTSEDTAVITTDWLDPKRKAIPIINADFDEFGAAGPIGTNMLVVFPHGLSQKAVVEGFGYGADNSPGGRTWKWSFKAADEKGYLSIQSEQATRGRRTITLLHWNGRYYVPVKSTIQTWADY